MTRAELIAALDASTGPSRELDAEIFRLIGLTELQECHCKQWCRQDARSDLTRDHYLRAWSPDYTASIDAALQLVPDDVCWTISVPRHPDMSGKRYWASMHGGHPGSRGATHAIALCIAALKAGEKG